jgi:hypothetical protein
MVARYEHICPQKTGLLTAAEEGMQAHICESEAEAIAWLDAQGPNADRARRVSAWLVAAPVCAGFKPASTCPSTLEVYDAECQVVAKHMTLQEVQVAAVGVAEPILCCADRCRGRHYGGVGHRLWLDRDRG